MCMCWYQEFVNIYEYSHLRRNVATKTFSIHS